MGRIDDEIKQYRAKGVIDNFVKESGKDAFNDLLEDFFCIELNVAAKSFLLPGRPIKMAGPILLLITSGTLSIKVGFESLVVKAGELLVIQSGKVFFMDEIDNSIEGYSCHFSSDLLVSDFVSSEFLQSLDFLEIWANSCYSIESERADFAIGIYRRLYAEYHSKTPSSEVLVVNVLALLVELKQALKSGNSQHSRASQIVIRFKQEVYRMLGEPIGVKEVAKALYITPNHLNKSVKEVTGESASVFIEKAKLTEAKFLLYQTDIPVSEIAERVGILDQSYFSRFFKKHEALTPLQFRKKIDLS